MSRVTPAPLRLAREADLCAVKACVDAAFDRYVVRIGKPPGPMLLDFAAQIRAGHVWLATGTSTATAEADADADAGAEPGPVLGVLVQYETSAGFYIDTVAVRPEAQGTGVGKRLLQFAEQEALRRGHTSISLCTNAHMTENQVFYPRIGYVERERRHEAGYDRIYYVKSLVESRPVVEP